MRPRGREGGRGSLVWLQCPLSYARESAGLRLWDPTHTHTQILHHLKTKASIYCCAMALSPGSPPPQLTLSGSDTGPRRNRVLEAPLRTRFGRSCCVCFKKETALFPRRCFHKQSLSLARRWSERLLSSSQASRGDVMKPVAVWSLQGSSELINKISLNHHDTCVCYKNIDSC